MYFKASGQKYIKQREAFLGERYRSEILVFFITTNTIMNTHYLLLLQNMKPPIATTANIAKRHPITAPAITPDQERTSITHY